MVDFLDPDLLAALDGVQGRRFSGHVRRVTWATRNPLAGSSGGDAGRDTTPSSFGHHRNG
ncbi:MAG: hypothetical protein OXJ56_09205 [Rhodospirillaceae bacterium]|nr:hypothetical protein [Rhodospirillaceae bacterium]